jgi:DNA-binding NarL/FixJ family response regulator
MAIPLKTRVLLADDHEIVRSGLRAVLEAEPDIEVVAEAADGLEAVERGLSADIHLAIVDVSMPKLTGLQVAAELRRRRKGLRVLILSVHDNERYFFEALRAGAAGYVLKSAANHDLIDACRAAMRGEPFLCPRAVTTLIREYLEQARRGEVELRDPLTARELQVVKLIAEGHSSDGIAGELVISRKTVDHHRASILGKLGLRSVAELTRYAIRRGLIEP